MKRKRYYLYILLSFVLISCAIKENDDIIADIKNVSTHHACKQNYEKITSGWIKNKQLESLKSYLEDSCRIDLDKEKIINIAYKMPISHCRKEYTSHTSKEKGATNHLHF